MAICLWRILYRMPPKNYKNIKSPNDLRVILSRAINMLLLDQIDTSTASALSSLASVMLKTLQVTELEKRVSNLEKDQDTKNNENFSPVVSDISSHIKQLRN